MSSDSWIYLDHFATTPVAAPVLEIMLPYFTEHFGNSQSETHAHGWVARDALAKARTQLANLCGVPSRHVVFTSGATEANNWVLRSFCAKKLAEDPARSVHILSSRVEHASILKTLEDLQKNPRVVVDWIGVGPGGEIPDESELEKYRKPETSLVCAMWVQNETGAINPMQRLVTWAHTHGIAVLSDGTQALGKIPVNLEKTPVDFFTCSAHKLYGPKGIGALVFRERPRPDHPLIPLITGGSHEFGLRSGTVNVPAVVGFGAACELMKNEMETNVQRIGELRKILWQGLLQIDPQLKWNGAPQGKTFDASSTTLPVSGEPGLLAGALSVTFQSVKVPALITGVSFSRGSACSSSNPQGSQVLSEIGLTEFERQNTLRFCLGRSTTIDDITQALNHLRRAFAV